MPDLGFNQRSDIVQLTGSDELYTADVELIAGKKKLLTDATVTVESVFGKDGFADSWFAIGDFDDCSGVGAENDTIRVQIVAGCDATEFPAVDVTYTITASDVAAAQPEISVRDNIVTALNGNSNFATSWKATKVKDNGIIVIQAKFRGEIGERPVANDIQVTATGTTTVTLAFNNILQRGKETSLTKDPDDPRIGVLGISGTVNVTPGSIGSRYQEFFENASSSNLLVNGSVTPVVFTIPLSSTDDIFIEQLRFFGGGNGIKFGQFLSKSGIGLTNGILIEIKSDDETFTFPVIKKTEDFKNIFSAPSGSDFRIDIQAGSDQILAIFNPEIPFALRKIGTFTTDDYAKITVRDDLTSGIQTLQSTAIGFTKEA